MKIEILGVKIDQLTKQEIVNYLDDFINTDHLHQIVTLNPEFIMAAQKDSEFKKILNNADLSIVDGVGLKFAALLKGYNLPRITGVELTKDLLKEAEEKDLKITVINWSRGLSLKKDIIETLRKNYPKLQFQVLEAERNDYQLDKEIITFAPQIMFVTLGAPWQEKFINSNLSKMPFVRVAIGVGGTFDYLSGKIQRAPLMMRKIGLEWLFRLIKQPWRLKRIITATIKFSIAVIKSK